MTDLSYDYTADDMARIEREAYDRGHANAQDQMYSKLIDLTAAAGDALLELSQAGTVEDIRKHPTSTHAQIEKAMGFLRGALGSNG